MSDTDPPSVADADTDADADADPDAGIDSDAPAASTDTDPVVEGGVEAAPAGGSGEGQLVRSSGIVAVGTLLSRITGLGRTVFLAYTIGAAGAANAYNLANTTPNLVYDMLLGGILSATLIPVLVANRDRGDQEGSDAVLTVATMALVVITVLGFVLTPAIIHLYATVAGGGGNAPNAAEQDLAISLLRLFVPQVLFYGLTTLGSSVLNTQRRFAAAAFAPVANNVVMFGVLIVANAMIARSTTGAALTVDDVAGNPALLLVLGLGTTAGIAAMVAVLAPAIWRAGIRLRWRFDWRNPSVVKVARLSGWTLGYVLSNQIALFALTAFAWGSRDRQAVSAWNYAYQFFQLPYGVFTVSVMTAFTPELASLHDRNEHRGFNERFLLGLRLVLLVLLPATVVFVVLARPIVSVMLEHGKLGPDDAIVTAGTVATLAVGMVGFSIYLYVLRAFYARKDTRTPFMINVFENVLTVIVAVPLIRTYGVAGLGLAWSIGYTVSAAIAFVILQRRIGPFGLRLAVGTTAPVARMVAASVAMLVLVAVVARVLPLSGWGALVTLVVGSGAGAALYLGLLYVWHVPEIHEIRRLVLRR